MIDEFYKVLRTPKPSITHTLGKTQDMVFSQSFRFYGPLNKFFPKHSMLSPSTKFMKKFWELKFSLGLGQFKSQ